MPALLLCLLLILAGPARAEVRAAADPARSCLQAISVVEREYGLPAGLLLAIARVESGRPDPAVGTLLPWPWTINAEGEGRWFASQEEAVAAVRALQARGVRLIDIGCLQVNLHHHPEAFASLETGFDPLANARYAARFLRRLHAASGRWEQAAAQYHSTTPERAEAYRLRVLAAWPQMARRLAEERRREALVAAWRTRPAATPPRNGFQAVALAARGARQVAGRFLLDPPRRLVRRPGRAPVVELAEAPPGR